MVGVCVTGDDLSTSKVGATVVGVRVVGVRVVGAKEVGGNVLGAALGWSEAVVEGGSVGACVGSTLASTGSTVSAF